MFHIDAINLKILDFHTYVNVKILFPISAVIIYNYFHGIRGSQKLNLALKHLFHRCSLEVICTGAEIGCVGYICKMG